MTETLVSVIVVSRGRPDALIRCLMGIEQLYHQSFEVIVVADPVGLAAVSQARFDGRIKAIPFDQPNISAARNLGLMTAAGDVVAFIDDDAVPEPTWLGFLTQPFDDDRIACAGGYVRGRNGISFQNTARTVDATGQHNDLPLSGDDPQVFTAKPGLAIKTEGTNCAFRRDVLLAMGGFDRAFPFYMDETDVNLRLAADGRKTAIVPLAQVHHGFAASDRRQASRMPRSLFDIGASQIVLLRKHALGVDHAAVLQQVRIGQKARLIRHMVAGTCEPRDVAAMLLTLEAGFAAGQSRKVPTATALIAKNIPFLQFEPRVRFKDMICLGGRLWNSGAVRRRAAQMVSRGQRVSIFLFTATALFHRVKFSADGVWEQAGGLWGKSDRMDPLIAFWRSSSRLKREMARVSCTRTENS